MVTTLRDLRPGQSAVVTAVGGEGVLRRHFLDLGVIPGARIDLIRYAPLGDPAEYVVQGYDLSLRLVEAAQIEIGEIGATPPASAPPRRPRGAAHHPGLGENTADEQDAALLTRRNPDAEPELSLALVGNQNCGKTTLFNCLTGENQHVGNFPGVTVDRKTGIVKGHPRTTITDLPGIYSLTPYSAEENVARDWILKSHPSAVINIVDATNMARNLYLTMQLLELKIPMVIALNMMDELEGNGGEILVNELEARLQVPVVPIAAAKNQGVRELVSHVVHVAKNRELPGKQDFCDKEAHGGAVHRGLHSIRHLIEDKAQVAGVSEIFAAEKLMEGDEQLARLLGLSPGEISAVTAVIGQTERERGLDGPAAVAEMRFAFIQGLCRDTVIRPAESREHERSRKLDNVLTGHYTGIPAFVAIMALVFYLTFNVAGPFCQDLISAGLAATATTVDGYLTAAAVNPWLRSFILDAGFNGIGTVVSFVPIIVFLFFFLSLLEDSGYMARVAFVMDKPLRKIGLSGRSIVPLLVGFGCTVPAVMATRTLPSARDRRLTIVLTPFMSCSAKVPIYAFLTAAFFPRHGALIMVCLYFGGIALGILAATAGKRYLFRGEAVPFVMELPNYRLPGLSTTLRLVRDKTADFLSRAFTVIFVGIIVVWFLQTFDFGFNPCSDPAASMLAAIAGRVAPLFAPCGLDDWRVVVALLAGVLAKESVVASLSMSYGAAALTAQFTPAAAAALLTFCLLYTPCVAALASVRRESGYIWAGRMVVRQCLIAWAAAAIVYRLVLWGG